MLLIIILSVVVALLCMTIGFALGASAMQASHRKSLARIKTMVDNIADRLKNEQTAVEQVNKLKERLDAKK